MRSPRLILVLGLLMLAGCRHYRVRRGVPGIPINPTASAFSYADQEQESTPSIIPNDSLLDQATIGTEPTRTCANVLLRQPVGWDVSPGLFDIRCANGHDKVNGAVVFEQQAEMRDYPFTGQAPQLNLYGYGMGISVPIGPREERIFRVAERSFTVCCPIIAGEIFRLSMTSRVQSWWVRTDFVWHLQLP